jgi:hypothetical protein
MNLTGQEFCLLDVVGLHDAALMMEAIASGQANRVQFTTDGNKA